MSNTHFRPPFQLLHFANNPFYLSHLLAHTFIYRWEIRAFESVPTNVYRRSHFVDENRLTHCMALQYYGLYVCHSHYVRSVDAIFLGKCTQTIKWKVNTANKQKFRNGKPPTPGMYYASNDVYDDDDDDGDDNLNTPYIFFFKWNHLVYD